MPDCPDDDETSDAGDSGSSSSSSSGAERTDGTSDEVADTYDPDSGFTFDGWKTLLERQVKEQEQEEVVILPLRTSIAIDERGLIKISFSKEMDFPENFAKMIQNGIPKRGRLLSGKIIEVKVEGAPD